MADNRQLTLGDTSDTGAVSGRGQMEWLDGELKAPDNIIMTVSAARTYYQNFRSSHLSRIKLMAAIEGLIQGNPPYPPEKLAAAGLGHIANVNTLDAKAMYERVALTFWNLVNQTENWVVFEIEKLNDLGQDHDYSGWAQILAQTWTQAVKKKWRGFVKQLNIMTGQLVKFGVSPIVWSDERDCRWSSVDLNMFYCPDRCSVDSDNWDCMCIETYFTVQKLYTIYLEERNKESTGWNIDELEKFILRKANLNNKGSGNEFQDMLEIQKAIQNHSFNFAASFTDNLRLVSLLYREFSGKVSHYIFDPMGDATDFLMMVSEQYESFDEGLIVFTANPGEGLIFGNRGVGHKIYPVCQIMMRVDNSMVDMSSMASTPIIKSNSTGGRSLDPIRFIPGVATDIGQSEFQQNNLGANIPGLVQVGQYFDQKVNKNAIIGGDDPGYPDQDRGSKSAPEVQMQSIKEFGIGKQSVAHFYETQDVVIEQMTIKLLHCKEGYPCYAIYDYWKKQAIKKGVPEEIFSIPEGTPANELPDHLSVRAARVAGDGSNLGLIMGLNGVAGIAGGFGQKGQYNYRKDLITSRLGSDYVERYLSDSAQPDESGSGASLAQLENLAMQDGKYPQATQDNNHKVHIGSHMALFKQIEGAVQDQSMDPIAADKVLSVMVPHLQEHVNFLTQDPLNRGFIEQFTPQFRQVFKFAQYNKVTAQKMMKAEIRRRDQAQQQLSADQIDQQRKDMVAQKEQARKDLESQQKQNRAKEQSDVKAEVMKKSVELKADNERHAIELKAGNEAQKNTAQITHTPQEILADTSTEQLQQSLRNQVGNSPNPADFS